MNDREYDDLTVIKYIGPKLEMWLREEMQVRTYRDLADLTTKEIQTQLNADNKVVAKFKIEIWIEQAEELALETAERDAALAAAEKQAAAAKKAGDWEEYASFLVYFEAREVNGKQKKRIKVSHIEKDESDVWSNLTAEHFLWMLEQAGEGPFPNAPKAEPAPEVVGKAAEAEVKVKQIRLYQPPEAKKPLIADNGKSKTQDLRSGEPFTLEVFFSLIGEGAKSVAKREAEYSVRAVASETDSKAGADLGDSAPEALVEGTFDYSVRMPEVTLDRGVHRLWAMVSVDAANTIPNFLEGPSVKVV